MSYNKLIWKNKDIITADKLNHMEDGIGDSALVIELIENQETYDLTPKRDYTFGEIRKAFEGGASISLMLIRDDEPNGIVARQGYKINELTYTITEGHSEGAAGYYAGELHFETAGSTLEELDNVIYGAPVEIIDENM